MDNSSSRGDILQSMANNSSEQNNTEDRRDLAREGSTLSGSSKRNNEVTEKALHPDRDQHTGMDESGVIARQPDSEAVDQNPGHRQKQNQNGEKDDPLAA
jgi:hypothetical protein